LDEALLMMSLAVFTLIAGLCSVVFNRLKVPPLIGYLIAGIILANIWTITEEGEMVVDYLSDMGLVLLMFCIGLEINLRKLKKQGMFAIIVCMVQMPIILVAGYLVGMGMGMGMVPALALGAIMSGSSTAVVLAVLKSQNYLDKEHNEMIIMVLIIEDIAQVILLSILGPLMAGSGMDPSRLLIMIVSIIVFMAGSIFIGLRLLPIFINWLSDNVPKEVLIIIVLGLTFGMAYLSILVGLSMAIGAFLMGLIVSSTRKSHEIHHSIEPMENLFMAMFFISVGMEVSVHALVNNIIPTILIYLSFLVIKVVAVFIGYFVANEKGRVCFLSAISLTVMGEFAFIIAKEALNQNVIGQDIYTSVIGAALISMILLPIIAKFAERMWDHLENRSPERLRPLIDRIVQKRDDIYYNITMTSSKSRSALRRSMAFAYINVIIIVLIQIVFTFTVPISDWLVDNLGFTAVTWDWILTIVRALLTFIPAYRLVLEVRFLDSIVIKSSKLMTRRLGSYASYSKALRFNTVLLAFIIVCVIIAILPNPLLGWDQFILFGATAGVLLFFYVLSILKKINDKDSEESAQMDEESFGDEEKDEEDDEIPEDYADLTPESVTAEETEQDDTSLEVFMTEVRTDR